MKDHIFLYKIKITKKLKKYRFLITINSSIIITRINFYSNAYSGNSLGVVFHKVRTFSREFYIKTAVTEFSFEFAYILTQMSVYCEFIARML